MLILQVRNVGSEGKNGFPAFTLLVSGAASTAPQVPGSEPAQGHETFESPL